MYANRVQFSWTPLLGVDLGRRSQQPDPIAVIHALLEVPSKLGQDRHERALVVFDEFQALMALDGLDGVFRSHLQHHDRVSYIFSGSEPSLLRALFEDRARPLYGQAELIGLERISFAAAHDFIAHRFTASGKDSGEATAEVVRLSERHPQRLMLLAYHLWEQVTVERPAQLSDLRIAYDASLRAVDAELRFLWDSLSANERRVLAAVASGFSPYGSQARAYTGLRNSSSAQRAAKALATRSVLEDDDGGDLTVLDPLLARWVRRRGAARAKIWVLPAWDGSFRVTDGPSLAFIRAEGLDLEEAQHEADRIAAAGRGADVMIIDSDDPNDLPDWAVAPLE